MALDPKTSTFVGIVAAAMGVTKQALIHHYIVAGLRRDAPKLEAVIKEGEIEQALKGVAAKDGIGKRQAEKDKGEEDATT